MSIPLVRTLEYCMTMYNSESDCVLALVSRFETLDLTSRLLVPIIVLQNHNRYNIMENGHNYSINVQEIETEVCFFGSEFVNLLLNSNSDWW